MTLSAQSIRHWPGLFIVPFNEPTVCEGRTFGLSSCGYDVRIAGGLTLYPLIGRLASIVEHITMPDDLWAEVKDKSTNARQFIAVQNTVIEPGWRGHLTLELTLHRLRPVTLKSGTPIAQIMFHRLDEPTISPYAGKYQAQGPEPVPAILQ